MPTPKSTTQVWLAEAVKAWRKAEGLSRYGAAVRLGVSAETIRDLETCRRRPGPEVLRRLYRAGIDVPMAFWAKLEFLDHGGWR